MFIYALLILILAVIGWLIYMLATVKKLLGVSGYDDLETKQKRTLIISLIALLSFIILVLVGIKCKIWKKLMRGNRRIMAQPEYQSQFEPQYEQQYEQQYIDEDMAGNVTLPVDSLGTLSPGTYSNMMQQMGLQ